MSDPTPDPRAFLLAQELVNHIEQNLSIQFKIEGDNWTREQFEANVRAREACLKVQQLLLNEAERSMK